jgi:hypothetical protein
MVARKHSVGVLISLAVVVLSGCASNEVWTTPLAPPRHARVAKCAVSTSTGPPEEAVDNLASVRCHYTGQGTDCVDLAIEQACYIGGDVVYGLHCEDVDLVGTIGVRRGAPVAAQ